MKQSELFRKLSEEEDNDLKALSLNKKAIRAKNIERIIEGDYINKLEAKGYDVFVDKDKIYIETFSKYKTIDFFPKANRLLIRKDNKWEDNALNWIIKNLL
jgi:hypothetical protein